MKRMHIHVGVDNIDQSIKFYSALFGADPIKAKTDYAKWMLDDPCVNFAISDRSGKTGVDHLGLQVEHDSELSDLRERIQNADMSIVDEGETVCCYARSDKSWVEDPNGIAWEAYKTMEDVQVFSTSELNDAEGDACCAPTTTSCAPTQQETQSSCSPIESSTGCC